MATATLSLIGTELGFGEWLSTPSTPEADHWTLMSEAPPGNDTDYIHVQGHVAQKTERTILSHGPGDIALVRSLSLDTFRLYGALVTNYPACRFRVLVGGVVKGERIIGMDTGGQWETPFLNIPFPTPVPGLEWYGNTIVLEFFPMNGDAGYGPYNQG